MVFGPQVWDKLLQRGEKKLGKGRTAHHLAVSGTITMATAIRGSGSGAGTVNQWLELVWLTERILA